VISHVFNLEKLSEAFYRLRLENDLNRLYTQVEHQISGINLIFWQVGLLVSHISKC